MKKITDEMLNDYIDGLLNLNELKEIEEALKSDAELPEKLRALQTVDKELKALETESAPESITEKVMEAVTVSKKREASGFFFAMISFLGLIFAGVLSVALFWNDGTTVNESGILNFTEKVKNYVSPDLSFLKSFILSNDLMIALGGLSLVFLIFFYFLLNSHKAFKDDLNRFTA